VHMEESLGFEYICWLNFRLCGHWEMLLVTPLSAVILCSAMER
jgi:hypothetical protein